MALEEARVRFGSLHIFNTDQASQLTIFTFTTVLTGVEIRISKDGRGRYMDNVSFGRLWRSIKCECVYFHAFETVSELWGGLRHWIGYYNADRPLSGLTGLTPREAYGANEMQPLAGLVPPAKTLLFAA
jgi:putative transposase